MMEADRVSEQTRLAETAKGLQWVELGSTRFLKERLLMDGKLTFCLSANSSDKSVQSCVILRHIK